MVKIEYLADYSGATRFGTCVGCSKGSKEDPEMVRVTFWTGSRQAAINALERTKRIANYELHGGEVLRTFNVVLNSLINIMSLLPPANNSEIPNSSDTISRQEAIDT